MPSAATANRRPTDTAHKVRRLSRAGQGHKEMMQNLTYPRKELTKDKADSLTQDYTSPPIPVLDIAESQGVNVVFDEMGKYSELISGFCDFRKQRLFVNANDHVSRQTFTIAHELGHWLLHRDFFLEDASRYPVLPRFQSVDVSNPYEQEANDFAANLLVPARLLVPVRGAPVSVLASIFGVSKQMMEIRLKNVR